MNITKDVKYIYYVMILPLQWLMKNVLLEYSKSIYVVIGEFLRGRTLP